MRSRETKLRKAMSTITQVGPDETGGGDGEVGVLESWQEVKACCI
jgi:hypothetical protein